MKVVKFDPNTSDLIMELYLMLLTPLPNKDVLKLNFLSLTAGLTC